MKPEKAKPSTTLKLRTTRKEIAATTSTWEMETNISKDIELDIKAATMTPSTVVREGLLRSMAELTIRDETVM